jgi:pimeloyl-ACP methyl ester carboxylesterase
MKRCIEGRELITLDRQSPRVEGTYHRARGVGGDLSAEGRVGIVFVNSLSLPRAATGDSSVYWADCLAACGYPSFRIDFPGLGDSDGCLPQDLLNFINSGGFVAAAAQKVREIVDRFNLSGVVIVGHCAGGVSALLVASECVECKGLILLDVYFHLVQAIRPKLRQKLSEWALRSRTGRLTSDIYHRLELIRLSLRGNRPPENANLPLLRCWEKVASSGLPILFLKVPDRRGLGAKPRIGQFDYLDYLMKRAGKRHRVTLKLAEGTDHSFADRIGRAAVRRQTEEWLKSSFPTVA